MFYRQSGLFFFSSGRLLWLHSGQGAVVLKLHQRQFGFPSLLVDQIVVVLGGDVKGVSFLGVELSCVEDDGDFTFKTHENHRILVRA